MPGGAVETRIRPDLTFLAVGEEDQGHARPLVLLLRGRGRCEPKPFDQGKSPDQPRGISAVKHIAAAGGVYRLDREGRYLGEKDFISGWLTEDGISLGRPVDIMIQPDGTIFVSDDKAGAIYRITRKK